MERIIYQELLSWKESRSRKPLILEGARQTGKTWILKEFGKREFEHLVYINCDNNPDIRGLFSDFSIERILRILSVLTSQEIIPGKTLVFFDEIQEVPLGITSLKYFCEDAPDLHVAAAGSLLGISMHEGSGFPVGKVDRLKLYPFSFYEFLMALDQKQVLSLLQEHRYEECCILREKMLDLLRQYYFVGGMPAAVSYYIQSGDIRGVRKIQDDILVDYRRDFSKHIPPEEVARVNMVWDSVPAQLAKENKKFIYGVLKKGSRAKEFEKAIQWLLDAGLIYKIKRVTKLEKPLKFYEDNAAFKLYLLDVGLLGALSGAPPKDILSGNAGFTEYKGAFTENYVVQQFVSAAGEELYYYVNERGSVEIDFVIQTDQVHPVEVKAEENLRSRSLKSILDKDEGLHGWRMSMSDYRVQTRLTNISLFLTESWFREQMKERLENQS